MIDGSTEALKQNNLGKKNRKREEIKFPTNVISVSGKITCPEFPKTQHTHAPEINLFGISMMSL